MKPRDQWSDWDIYETEEKFRLEEVKKNAVRQSGTKGEVIRPESEGPGGLLELRGVGTSVEGQEVAKESGEFQKSNVQKKRGVKDLVSKRWTRRKLKETTVNGSKN